ncbi:hypothetical protein KBD34_00540 [Patescibacteria group bacterium]|nr:hypothetical protein [Patescibacteria group bacterium]
MNACITCGMPFEGNHVNDIGLHTTDGPVCVFDSKDGAVKSGDEIFEGGIEFFSGAAAQGDHALAERLTRKNMKSLPYWQAHPFERLMNGPEATDAEFGEAMAKL